MRYGIVSAKGISLSGLEHFLSELPARTRERIVATARAKKQSVEEFVVASLMENSERPNASETSNIGEFGDRLLRVPEAASFVGLSISMLNKMRVAGTGPRYVKLAAKAVGYWQSDLVIWLNARVCHSTSEVYSST